MNKILYLLVISLMFAFFGCVPYMPCSQICEKHGMEPYSCAQGNMCFCINAEGQVKRKRLYVYPNGMEHRAVCEDIVYEREDE